jgi:CBS domain-containing protein
MIKLRDIMTRDVVTLSPDLTIREAMDLLSTQHLSGAPVAVGGRVVGVVTATDLMRFAAALPGAPTERDQEEWEETSAREAEAEEESEPAATYFSELWTDTGADTSVRFADIAGPEWNVLEEHTVAEAMTESPISTMSPDTPVTAVAEFMQKHHIHRVLAMEGEKLVGIATTMDIADAVAEHKLTSRTYVFGEDSRFDKRGWER